jgi:hypothetical protein
VTSFTELRQIVANEGKVDPEIGAIETKVNL